MATNKTSAAAALEAAQDINPVAGLIGKKFLVESMKDENATIIDRQSGEPIERIRRSIVTNSGTYISYSRTVNNALDLAVQLFGEDFSKTYFTIEKAMRGATMVYKVLVAE